LVKILRRHNAVLQTVRQMKVSCQERCNVTACSSTIG